MKRLIRMAALLLCIAVVMVMSMTVSAAADAGDTGLTAHEALKDIVIGWNLGNSLDCYESPEFGADGMVSEELWGSPPVARELISEVKKAGFNAIRIPITWYNHMNKDDGTIDPEWMRRVKTVVDYAVDEGFYTVINIHHDTGTKGWLRADKAHYEENRDRFVKIWQQISDEFRDYGDKLMFEGFNEHLDEYDTWDEPSDEALKMGNDLNQVFVDTVRATGGNNENRILVVKTYCSSTAYKALDAFVMPNDTAADKLIAAVHIYRPFDFTNENYPQIKEWSSYELDRNTARVDQFFAKKNIPLIIEEFGCVDKNNENERISWSKYFVETFTKLGIKCFWWDNGSEYRLFDREHNVICQRSLTGTIIAAAKGETYQFDLWSWLVS